MAGTEIHKILKSGRSTGRFRMVYVSDELGGAVAMCMCKDGHTEIGAENCVHAKKNVNQVSKIVKV